MVSSIFCRASLTACLNPLCSSSSGSGSPCHTSFSSKKRKQLGVKGISVLFAVAVETKGRVGDAFSSEA